jgi:Gamma-glutamyltransferase
LIRTPAGNSEVVDFREEAPAQAHRDLFDGRPDARVVTGLAVAVPGELRGLQTIHTRHGQLPWSDVVAPAVHLARRGFEVSADLVRFMEGAIEGRDDFFLTEPWAEDFAPDGPRVTVGSTMTRHRYADTLEKIATLGADVFYTGPMAQSMAGSVRDAGGILTADDLSQYRVVIREPVEVSYRGFILRSCPSPAGGPVTLSILKTLEGFDPAAQAGFNVSCHRLNEAFRFGFGARTQLGDPRFTTEVRQREEAILTDTYATYVRSNIWDGTTRPRDVYNPSQQQITTSVSGSFLTSLCPVSVNSTHALRKTGGHYTPGCGRP